MLLYSELICFAWRNTLTSIFEVNFFFKNSNEGLFVRLHQKGAKNTQTSPNIFSWRHNCCCVLLWSSQGRGCGHAVEAVRGLAGGDIAWGLKESDGQQGMHEWEPPSIHPSISTSIHPPESARKTTVCSLSFIPLHRGLKGIGYQFDLWHRPMTSKQMDLPFNQQKEG